MYSHHDTIYHTVTQPREPSPEPALCSLNQQFQNCDLNRLFFFFKWPSICYFVSAIVNELIHTQPLPLCLSAEIDKLIGQRPESIVCIPNLLEPPLRLKSAKLSQQSKCWSQAPKEILIVCGKMMWWCYIDIVILNYAFYPTNTGECMLVLKANYLKAFGNPSSKETALNHLTLFITQATHWSHLGSFKTPGTDPTQRYWSSPEVGLGEPQYQSYLKWLWAQVGW